jgi:hypothetical protein
MCVHCELPVRTPDFEHHGESFRHISRGNARNQKPELNVEGYGVDQLRARGARATGFSDIAATSVLWGASMTL